MTRGRRGGVFAAAIATGLVVLVWAAAAGPVAILSDSGRRFVFRPPPPTPTATPSGAGVETLREATRDVERTLDLGWLGGLVVWTLLLAAVLAAFLGLRQLWVNRWRPPERPADVDFDVLPEAAVSEALQADVTRQLAAVQEGSPRNGIVRCWLRLEEGVAAAGLPRSPWETSAEFTVRILHALDLDPRAIGELSRLYREARFSEHELGEPARTAARSALQQLHSDLRELGVPPAQRSAQGSAQRSAQRDAGR